MLADCRFFATSHGKEENDSVGGGKNSVWWKVLQGKAVVEDLELFVTTVAKSKYPDFLIERFKIAETCKATKHLNKLNEKNSHKTAQYTQVSSITAQVSSYHY